MTPQSQKPSPNPDPLPETDPTNQQQEQEEEEPLPQTEQEEEEEPDEEEPEEEEPEEEEPEEMFEEEVEEEEEEEMVEDGGGEGEEGKDAPEVVKEKRKQKEFEVFVGGLPRDATESDLEKVFKKVGEVVEVRLVKSHNSDKNKGFAFVRFATVEQAKKAATELSRTVVKGKSCGVIRNNDNETLHLGNICTSWTKDDLVEKLKTLELENLEDVHLIDDPHNKGKNRGYAFLDFSTHTDAKEACFKLKRRDVFLGTDVRAEISFSKTVEPDEEVMKQVKSVFLDGLPATWDEAKLREQFKKFGEIESVQLASNMPTAKRKDFGFINFATREAALECIESVNKNGVGEGDSKVLVKATLKKPLQKRAPQALGVRGGHIGKSFSMRGQQLYGFGRSFQSRPARSYEPMGRSCSNRSRGIGRPSSRGLGGPSSRGDDYRAAISPPTGKYESRVRNEAARRIPGTVIGSSRSRGPYYESSSSARSQRHYMPTNSRSRGPYSDVDVYDPRFEQHESYEYYDTPGYRRAYPEMDHDMLESSSLTRGGRSRPALEMDPYPQGGSRSGLEMSAYHRHDRSAYDEYPRYLPDERLAYDTAPQYATRGYGGRHLSGGGPSRYYH